MVSPAALTQDRSSAARTIRLLVADGRRPVRADLRGLVEREPGMTVVAEAATGEEAVRLAREVEPDVVLIDAAVRDGDCVHSTRALLAEGVATVVVLADSELDSRVFAALRAGAARRMLKDRVADQLVPAIRQCAAGGRRRRRSAHRFTTPTVVELVPRCA